MTKEKFEKIFGKKLKEKDGGLYYIQSISVSSYIKDLPDNLTIHGNLYIDSKKFTKLPKNLTVKGSLFIENTNIKKLPYDLIVYDHIYAANSKITTISNNFKVRGRLDLENTPIKKLPSNLVVTDYLNIKDTEITTLPDDFMVGSLTISNDNFIFPKNLSARTLTLFTFPNSLPIDLKVEYIIYRENYTTKVGKAPNIFNWGKYIKVDDEVYKIISVIKDNVYRIKSLHRDKYYYAAFDEEGFSLKHKSLEKAIKYLPYSVIGSASYYIGLPLDKKLSLIESVICYRTITRACLSGVMNFIENKNIKETDTFSIREIDKLARNTKYTRFFNEIFNLK